jgi:hypothetical protein
VNFTLIEVFGQNNEILNCAADAIIQKARIRASALFKD